MPDNDDPFGFLGDDTGARTVVKPIPGGSPAMVKRPGQGLREPSAQGPKGPRHEAMAPVAWPLTPGGGLNPIERAASALLLLMGKLFHATDHRDPEGLGNG